MGGNPAAMQAAKALSGGSSARKPPHATDDAPEEAGIIAVAHSKIGDAGTDVYRENETNGVITIGVENIQAQQDYTSKWTPDAPGSNTGTWDGLQRR